jgi:hypothetical protein
MVKQSLETHNQSFYQLFTFLKDTCDGDFGLVASCTLQRHPLTQIRALVVSHSIQVFFSAGGVAVFFVPTLVSLPAFSWA